MKQLKSTILATLGFVIAIAALGLFASVGLVMLGVVATLFVVASIAIILNSFLAKKDNASAPIA